VLTIEPDREERTISSPLVGRRDELAELAHRFDAAVAEQSCRVVTVVGEPGVGKSRLATEFESLLGDRARVLEGRCLPYGEGITYWPVREIVRTAVEIAPGDSREAARARIAAVLPEGADQDAVCKIVAAVAGHGEIAAHSDEIFWALRRFFEALAGDRPLVLVLDDIQWAEPTFLDLVEYVAGWSTDAPIVVLGLARTDLLDLRPSWAAQPWSETLRLERLTSAETERLVVNLAGGARVEDLAAAEIAKTTEGNPLFVEEMVRMLIEEGVADLRTIGVPATIQALLAARVDLLDAAERDVLQRAAVIGQIFSWRAVAELAAALGRGETGAILQRLVRKQLVAPHGSTPAGEDAFRFTHILVRDAVYQSIPKRSRAELHEQLATIIEAGSAEAEDLDEIVGHHLEQAHAYYAELGLAEERTEALGARAWRRLAVAGRRALRRGDAPAARNLLERAARLPAPDERARLELLLELGPALRQAGDLARAGDVLGQVRDEARALEDRPLELRAELESAYHRLYAEGGRAAELIATANSAIPVFARAGDELGLAKSWSLLAHGHFLACRFADMESALESAIEHARRAGDESELGVLESSLALALVAGPRSVEHALARCRAILERTEGSRSLHALVRMVVAFLVALDGELEEGRRLAAEAHAVLHDLGQEFSSAALRSYSGGIELLAGDPVAAERELRAAYELLSAMGERGNLSTVTAYLAQALAEQGLGEEAIGFSELSEEVGSPDDRLSLVIARAARADVRARGGDLEEAERLARQAMGLADETDSLELQAEARLGLARVRVAASQSAAAAEAAREALARYESKGHRPGAEKARELISSLDPERPPPLEAPVSP
jgi:hypothetical protein